MSPLPFCNNLKEGDRVKFGDRELVVVVTPRETSVNVKVEFPNGKQRYVPVTDLRLIVDGVPEDVPPIDGEVPAKPAKETKAPSHIDSFCAEHSVTKEERTALVTFLASYRALKTLQLA